MERQQPTLVGVFAYEDDLLAALKALQRKGRAFTFFSPVSNREIREAIGMKPSMIRYVTLFAAVLGIVMGLWLAVYTVLQWKFIVGGKPIVPYVPFVVVGFEICILFGVVFTFIGLLVIARIPRFRLPPYYDPRFSNDRFGIVVPFSSGDREEITKLMKEAGAEEVNEVQG